MYDERSRLTTPPVSIVGQLRPHLPQTTPNLAPILKPTSEQHLLFSLVLFRRSGFPPRNQDLSPPDRHFRYFSSKVLLVLIRSNFSCYPVIIPSFYRVRIAMGRDDENPSDRWGTLCINKPRGQVVGTCYRERERERERD